MAPWTLVLVVCTGIVLIMDRRRGTGQIVDLIDLDVEREGHVVTDELEAMMIEHPVDIATRPGEIVVDADDAGAALEQSLAQVRAEKPGAARDQHAFFEVHPRSLPKPTSPWSQCDLIGQLDG